MMIVSLTQTLDGWIVDGLAEGPLAVAGCIVNPIMRMFEDGAFFPYDYTLTGYDAFTDTYYLRISRQFTLPLG